jgi:hypothetical protein
MNSHPAVAAAVTASVTAPAVTGVHLDLRGV